MTNFPRFRKHPRYIPEAIGEALQGSADGLAAAFLWRETPEGEDYWHAQYKRLTAGLSLTIRAKQLLKRRMRYPVEVERRAASAAS